MELFDSHMVFQMPPDSDILLLPRTRRNVSRQCARQMPSSARPSRHREDVERRIAENTADRQATDEELKSLRPRWTPTDEAKAFIRSERQQRVKEGF